MKKTYLLAFISIFAIFLQSCSSTKNKEILSQDMKIQSSKSDTGQNEIDEIYSLLTYSIVYKYWDPIDRGGRGYNVGCILVDSNNLVVDYGINHVSELENATQHGEVRLMTSYLNKEGIYSLENHSIYSSLEPCAMCGGMMTMVSIDKTVNGQPDYYFSKALERLSFDSKSIGGFEPYPRTVKSINTPTKYGKLLDQAYHTYIEKGNKAIITKFLTTNEAKAIFEEASVDFLNFKVRLKQNQPIYEFALDFYHNLDSEPK